MAVVCASINICRVGWEFVGYRRRSEAVLSIPAGVALPASPAASRIPTRASRPAAATPAFAAAAAAAPAFAATAAAAATSATAAAAAAAAATAAAGFMYNEMLKLAFVFYRVIYDEIAVVDAVCASLLA